MQKRNIPKYCVVGMVFLAALGLVVNTPLQVQAQAPINLTVDDFDYERNDNGITQDSWVVDTFTTPNDWRLSYEQYLYIKLGRLNNKAWIWFDIDQWNDEEERWDWKSSYYVFYEEGPYTFGPATYSEGPSALRTYHGLIQISITVKLWLGAGVHGKDYARITSLGLSGTLTVTFYYPL